MAKTLNDYPMGAESADKVADKVKSIVGDSYFEDDHDEEMKKSRVFHAAVCDMAYAAKELYCGGDKTFDECLDGLIDAYTKLKGKEKDLLKLTK